jgi:hypothetical protein
MIPQKIGFEMDRSWEWMDENIGVCQLLQQQMIEFCKDLLTFFPLARLFRLQGASIAKWRG